MEVIQGKSKNKKIIIAQEIAFAKVLAGNNKTLRDRAVKKLKKWLTLRGNGKWTFTEEEFMRLWTGLFYCMWMSDKFLVQEELAESISSLIHCFRKNSESALLFIKCFNKRILMDWEGLDQYRIDKFNMFARRFLRQTFVYCKDKDWEEALLHKLMEIFYNVILQQDNSLGFVMHFISIYAEELAKVSKGKIKTEKVLLLIEPMVKLLARSMDVRIQKEAEDFFTYLMRQTDTGIEFEEKFNAWKEQGFPGEGPHCMKNLNASIQNQNAIENGDDLLSEEDEKEEISRPDEPLDPRAGSVHVFLPQIPIDIEGLISLFKKHQNSKQTNFKGRRILKSLIQKFEALKRGKFPIKIKKDPILTEPTKKKRQTIKNAKELLKFTQKLDEKPVRTKEFQIMMKELEKQSESSDSSEGELDEESEDVKHQEKISEFRQNVENSNQVVKKKRKEKINNGLNKLKKAQKDKFSNKVFEEVKENRDKKKKKKKRKNRKEKEKHEKPNISEEIAVKSKKKQKINGIADEIMVKPKKITPLNKNVRKRKILSNWQVQELDSGSTDFKETETPKVIKLERKISESSCGEIEAKKGGEDCKKNEREVEETSTKEIFPVFWEKAKKKVFKSSGTKGRVYLNPFAIVSSDPKSQSRRISFALDKNMAQENEEYLEEVKNSPRVPFDGSKKPIHSALKSGLAPSPVNPFYRFKKIKF